MKKEGSIRRSAKWMAIVSVAVILPVWTLSLWVTLRVLWGHIGAEVSAGCLSLGVDTLSPAEKFGVYWDTGGFECEWRPALEFYGGILPNCITLPLWFPFVFLLVPLMVDLFKRWRWNRERASCGNPCPSCGYDRAGLAQGAACPECGEGPEGGVGV